MSRWLVFCILGVAAASSGQTNFLDLYRCNDQWESINGRNGYRILDCNAQEVKNSDSCTGTNYICIGIVHCDPIDGVEFPPDIVDGPLEYMAGCHAINATTCKSPVKCMEESMEKHILKGEETVTRQERSINRRRSSR